MSRTLARNLAKSQSLANASGWERAETCNINPSDCGSKRIAVGGGLGLVVAGRSAGNPRSSAQLQSVAMGWEVVIADGRWGGQSTVWRGWLLVAPVPFCGRKVNRAEGRAEIPKVWLGGGRNLVVVDGNWGKLQLDWSVLSMLR